MATKKLLACEKANFETLRRAVMNGDAALVRCTMKGKPVAVVCAVNRPGDEFEMAPIAMLFTGNPYEILIPPK